MLEITGPNSHQGKQEKKEDEENDSWENKKNGNVALGIFFQLEGNNKNAWKCWEFLRMLMYFYFVLYCFYILGNVRDFQS